MVVGAARTEAAEAEERAALLMRLRRSGVRSLAVLRAMEAVPRAMFLPARYASQAPRDMTLPIGCGQTALPPSFIGRGLQALDCHADCSVLEIGSGSGFVTALLARMAGRVAGVERFRSLAEAAAGRLRELGLASAEVTWGDGLAAGDLDAGFDRIVMHVAVPAPPPAVLDRLAAGGVLVYPRGVGREQTLVRASLRADGTLSETAILPSQVAPAMEGRSQAL